MRALNPQTVQVIEYLSNRFSEDRDTATKLLSAVAGVVIGFRLPLLEATNEGINVSGKEAYMSRHFGTVRKVVAELNENLVIDTDLVQKVAEGIFVGRYSIAFAGLNKLFNQDSVQVKGIFDIVAKVEEALDPEVVNILTGYSKEAGQVEDLIASLIDKSFTVEVDTQ